MKMTLSLYDWCILNNKPNMIDEWDESNNVSMQNVAYGSDKKYAWRDSFGHRWDASPNNRTNHNTGCPVCAGRVLLHGFNDLVTTRPDIASEFMMDKNIGIDINSLTIHSIKKVWWKCSECGREWRAKVSERVAGHGCKSCTSKIKAENRVAKLLEDGGSLWDSGYDFINEWDYDKNYPLTPYDVTPMANRKAYWICSECGHSWKALINNRAFGNGCPECAKAKRVQTKTTNDILQRGSLADVNPRLAEEFLIEKNNDLKPSDILLHSGKLYWWKCKDCGCEWQATADSRADNKGCPECARNNSKSRLQRLVEKYIEEKYCLMMKHEFDCSLHCKNPKTSCNMPYDNEIVLSNGVKLIIEVHGVQHYQVTGWAKSKAKHYNITPEEAFEYQRWKDNYKQAYAIGQGYEYLIIPYWSETDESYQLIIDSKIHEILSKTQQND